MWLAAENGMFLRFTRGDWMTTMPEHLNMEWVDSVKVLKLKRLMKWNILTVFNLFFLLSFPFPFFFNSMFLSTSQRELPVPILSFGKLHLFGTINMQVLGPTALSYKC